MPDPTLYDLLEPDDATAEAPATAKPKRPRYRILTWDMEKQRWTPQKGVRSGPYTLFGLRKPLALLQSMGYDTNSPFVSVERIDP